MPSWEQFLMVLPRTPAGPDGAPVEIYGHGLTVSKETMFLVAGANADRGIATIGIDVPNHGDRRDEGGYLLDIATPRGFGRLASIPAEAISDNVGLIEAVRTSLAGTDLAPWRPDGTHGDGVADLDPSRLLYSGTSMGGVLGANSTGLFPSPCTPALGASSSGYGSRRRPRSTKRRSTAAFGRRRSSAAIGSRRRRSSAAIGSRRRRSSVGSTKRRCYAIGSSRRRTVRR
jgi:hypothetical protein